MIAFHGSYDSKFIQRYVTLLKTHHNGRRRRSQGALPTESGKMQEMKRLHLEAPYGRVSSEQTLH